MTTADRTTIGSRLKNVLSIHYCAIFVYLGLALGATGPTLGLLARQVGVNPGSMGLFVLSGSLGFIAGTLLSGWLFDRFPAHPLLGWALILSAGLSIWIPFGGSLRLLVILNGLRGISDAVAGTSPNTLLSWLHRKKASPWINALHFCFGIGAFLSPFLTGLFIGRGVGFRMVYLLLGTYALVLGLRFLFLGDSPRQLEQNPAMDKPKQSSPPAGLVFILAASLYLFFYVSTELSFATWLPFYITSLQLMDETGAAFVTSLFWLLFTGGRFLAIFLSLRIRPTMIIPVGIGGAFLALLLLLLLPLSLPLLITAVAMLGLSLAPLWAAGFSYAGNRIALTASISSLILFGDSLGGTILPSFTGKLIEVFGPRSMPLLVCCSLLCCLASFFIMRGVRVKGTGTG